MKHFFVNINGASETGKSIVTLLLSSKSHVCILLLPLYVWSWCSKQKISYFYLLSRFFVKKRTENHRACRFRSSYPYHFLHELEYLFLDHYSKIP